MMLCPTTKQRLTPTETNARKIAASVPFKDIPLCWRVVIHRYEHRNHVPMGSYYSAPTPPNTPRETIDDHP